MVEVKVKELVHISPPHWYSGKGVDIENSKECVCNEGDLGSIPELGRSLGEGKGFPLQYSALENSMDCIVHGVAESDTTEQLLLLL